MTSPSEKFPPLPSSVSRTSSGARLISEKTPVKIKPVKPSTSSAIPAPPLYLAASVTRGAANDDRFAAETSRMVVIANTDFLEPDRQRAENIDFLSSSANWLVHRESLTGLSPRTIGTYKLPLLDAQVSFINRLNLFFAPAAFLLIGGLIFSSRSS